MIAKVRPDTSSPKSNCITVDGKMIRATPVVASAIEQNNNKFFLNIFLVNELVVFFAQPV